MARKASGPNGERIALSDEDMKKAKKAQDAFHKKFTLRVSDDGPPRPIFKRRGN